MYYRFRSGLASCIVRRLALVLTAVISFGAYAAASSQLDDSVVGLRHLPQLKSILPALAEKRVVLVGETHDQYSHHLVELAIIQGLHARDRHLAIGVEFFQQPFQAALDDYIAGKTDEADMLRRTEYFERWGLDYRLYRPILQYARAQHIPVIALNVSTELHHRVAKVGFEGLTKDEKAHLPNIVHANEAYRRRLHAIFKEHPHHAEDDFSHFVDAQLLWDESMAAHAADYLRQHPDRPMVILCGSGHLAYGFGIPQRLARRVSATMASVLNDPGEPLRPGIADYVVFPKEVKLPRAGQLGILMEPTAGGISITGFTQGSAAEKAGLKKGDRLIQADGEAVTGLTDLRLALLDRNPGEKLALTVLRVHGAGQRTRRYTVELQ